ncbi:IucA/IucC family protein [Nocardioides oleivorans]|uniref:IucA/IucC family protein n=1 Tax=Nocardioides oleivorans TaxID=273676 RepID=UPI0013ECE67A|nr:IucA/IucC family protein [Nocardioides oleivorans]
MTHSPTDHLTDHLTPETMARAHRELVAKAIAEFAHERLLAPEPDGDDWQLTLGGSSYLFEARRHALEHWVVDPASIVRLVGERRAAVDAQDFVVDCNELLEIPEHLLAVYLEEIAGTLASATWKLTHHQLSSRDLVDADYQSIEAAMSEGHPGFVACNGRIGFGVDDHAAFAPETGADVRLHWVAVRRDEAQLSLSEGRTEAQHYAEELGTDVLVDFEKRLRDLGLDPVDYLYLPVHPWQWVNRLAVTFAPDVARRAVVPLGEVDSAHRAQQSIRTFFPVDRPERSYVKVALAVQNMGFLRGLSPAYMAATPAINDWVADLVRGDDELGSLGFTVLKEHAAIGWTGDAYHRLPVTSPYRKMVAALWRESPVPQLREGERLATMASLLHRDRDGVPLVGELVAASGLDPADWVATYLRAYLRPLVHCLLAHDLAFMPHGENLVMVLRDHVPVRMVMKDIGEEVAVLTDRPLPEEVERIRSVVPPATAALAIHTDVFDGFLRHLGGILAGADLLCDDHFWELVRETVSGHLDDHPELAEAAATYDLLRAEFAHSCLNRLQLRNTLQMVDLTDQAESLIYAGTLANPAAVRT